MHHKLWELCYCSLSQNPVMTENWYLWVCPNFLLPVRCHPAWYNKLHRECTDILFEKSSFIGTVQLLNIRERREVVRQSDVKSQGRIASQGFDFGETMKRSCSIIHGNMAAQQEGSPYTTINCHGCAPVVKSWLTVHRKSTQGWGPHSRYSQTSALPRLWRAGGRGSHSASLGHAAAQSRR